VIVGNNHLFDELHNNFSVDDVNQVVDEVVQPESG